MFLMTRGAVRPPHAAPIVGDDPLAMGCRRASPRQARGSPKQGSGPGANRREQTPWRRREAVVETPERPMGGLKARYRRRRRGDAGALEGEIVVIDASVAAKQDRSAAAERARGPSPSGGSSSSMTTGSADVVTASPPVHSLDCEHSPANITVR
jgi:hypothetical protein